MCKKENVNHKAGDIKCPCRQNYLKIRKRVTSGSASYPHREKISPIFRNFEEDFPQLHPTPTPRLQTADCRKVLNLDISKYNIQTEDSDDISNEKLLDTYFEAIDALQKCKNKYDKLRVLGLCYDMPYNKIYYDKLHVMLKA